MLVKKREAFLFGSLDPATAYREYDRIQQNLEEQRVREYFARLAFSNRRDRDRLCGTGPGYDE